MSNPPNSLARRGHTWENGHAERPIQTRKEEDVHRSEYDGTG